MVSKAEWPFHRKCLQQTTRFSLLRQTQVVQGRTEALLQVARLFRYAGLTVLFLGSFAQVLKPTLPDTPSSVIVWHFSATSHRCDFSLAIDYIRKSGTLIDFFNLIAPLRKYRNRHWKVRS